MKIYKFITTLALASIFLLGQGQAALAAERNTISVQGSAVTTVKPDLAYVAMNIELKEKTAEATREKLAAKLEELRRTMLILSIDSEEVKTTYYGLAPYTYATKNGMKTDGFVGRTGLSVKVKDLNKLGQVIDRVVGLGEVNIQGVSFDLQNRNLIEKRLLSEAVANAQEKAQMVANAGGRSLGSLVSADITAMGANRVNLDNAVLAMAKMSDELRTNTELNPGNITVTARVGTVWGLL